MEPIGGYFELELRSGSHYHIDAIKLNTARNCFEYILRAKKYKKVYIPYYTCEAILEPILKLNIDYEFYSIDGQLNPIFEKKFQDDEAFLYTNYFGLKHKTVELLAKKIGKNLIIDNTHAFFTKPINGIDTFYSARKFLGVADGAYLYTNVVLNINLEQDKSFNRMSHLLKRIDTSAEKAYMDFTQNEYVLTNQPIMKMSKLTNALLSSVDYENVKNTRIRNYKFLEKHLSIKNHFQLPFSGEVPLVYPFRTNNEALRTKLIENKIYVATYWPNVFIWCDENKLENLLAKQIIPIPIDQRYNENNLLSIIQILK